MCSTSGFKETDLMLFRWDTLTVDRFNRIVFPGKSSHSSTVILLKALLSFFNSYMHLYGFMGPITYKSLRHATIYHYTPIHYKYTHAYISSQLQHAYIATLQYPGPPFHPCSYISHFPVSCINCLDLAAQG